MAGARQPIQLVLSKGNKHLTKAEIEYRTESEVQPCNDDLTPPSYLTAAEKKRFAKLAEQLDKIAIMGETDVETLARYVTAQGLYEQAVKEMRRLQKDRPEAPGRDAAPEERGRYYIQLETWSMLTDNAVKRQDRYFKQAQTAATSLGLTISSRCRLQVPVSDEKPKTNKFSKFNQGKAAGDE